MIKQYITIALRNVLKDKVLSSINFINLITGFVTFVLITLFVEHELTWDKHHQNYERIYRVQLFMNQQHNVVQHSSSITAALSRHELLTVPEVEKIALLHDVGDNNKDGIFFSLDKKNQMQIRWGYYADPTIFDIFTFQFIEGDPSTALQKPLSIVLSKSMADKFFPTGNAVGKQIYGENKICFTVTGIYEDLPRNSEWLPSYILPMNSFTQITGWKDYEDNYWAYSFYTYVLLRPNARPEVVDTKIKNALYNYKREHLPYLRPLKSLHINPYFQKDIFHVIKLLSLSAILILILSSINYINLQTARGTTRLREIGIKKTVGFTKRQLYVQFVTESVLISFLAGVTAIIATQMVLPLFNSLIGTTGYMGVAITSNIFTKPIIIGLILVVSLLTGFISGFYPAYVISSFNPIKALKERNASERGGFGLKKILVTFQFSISLLLLIASFIVYLQTKYMVEGNLGFNSKKVVYANIVTSKEGSFEPIYQRLTQHPEIEEASFSNYIPFIIPGGDDLSWEGGESENKVFLRRFFITPNFFSTYDIPFVEGRNFSREFPDDYTKCVINETAVQVFKWENPIGKNIIYNDKKYEVIGVIRDYIAQSMHNPIEPQWYRLMSDSVKLEGIHSIRYSGETQKALAIIKKEFSEIFPEDAFEFKHIQTTIKNENASRAWKVIRNISILFAFISIIISSVGLFGLVMFYSRKKMKEIGIRKVLGFSPFNLYIKLSSEFIWLIAIAIIIAWPLGYSVYTYLPGAHKYQIHIWEFLLATSIILSVAVMTISYHLLKSIRTNPLEILKYE